MRIVKYLLILAVLGIISLSVFVATKDGAYTIEYTKETEISPSQLYKYTSDLRNYADWNGFELTDIKTDSVFKGINAMAKQGNSSISIVSLVPNKEVTYKIVHNSESTLNTVRFETVEENKTAIKWKSEGNLQFLDKFKALFLGSTKSLIGAPFEKMLNNINFKLKQELEKYEIKAEGIVLVPQNYFIKQIIITSIDQLGEKITESMESMTQFVKMNDFIKIKGKPFTIFNQLNVETGKVEYTVCLPIDKEIFTSEGSDITFAKTEPYYAYKSILTGDYTHSDKAWNKNNKEIKENGLTHNYNFKPIAIFSNSILDTHKPSLWITEMLTPINESVIPIKEEISTNTTPNLSSEVKKDSLK